ncbi:MAG TPA: amidase family protein, partial [Patescibacteria group bacterium]|nr:amidase family protein [Patescibacteria group bacterium]
MSDYLSLPIKEINELLKNKKILPIDLVNEFVEKVSNDQFNTFITLDIEGAIKQAHELENKEVDNLLFAIPLVINDNIVTKGIKTSCGSLMLDNFYPIYDASVVERVKEKNMIIVGKANMSEFDISLDEGYYGLVKNKINDEHIGGSGGSVVSVSVGYTPISLATSINENLSLASSLSQVVSLKPTYGLVSRYGLISPTSSFEQIAPISKNIIDNAILFDAIIGFDEKDYMTVKDYKFNINNLKTKLKNKRVAIPNYYLNDNLAEGENNLFKNII